jgi:hypothetical protein
MPQARAGAGAESDMLASEGCGETEEKDGCNADRQVVREAAKGLNNSPLKPVVCCTCAKCRPVPAKRGTNCKS